MSIIPIFGRFARPRIVRGGGATPTPTPDAPSSLVATAVTASQIDLTWTDNSDDETSFEIQRSFDGTTGWAPAGAVDANVTTFAHTGRSGSTTYYYRVRAFIGGTASDWSNVDSATTPAAEVGTPDAPDTPTLDLAMPNAAQIAWDEPEGATAYTIQRSADAGETWTTVGYASSSPYLDFGGTAVSESTYGLTPATAYRWRVAASNATGTSGYSAALEASTAAGPVVAPSAGTGITAVAQGPDSVRFGWDASAVAGTKYVLSRAPFGGDNLPIPPWTQVGLYAAPPTPGEAFGVTETGLTPGTGYFYSLRPYLHQTLVGSTTYNGVGAIPANLNRATTTYEATGISEHAGLMAVPYSPTRVDLTWLPVSEATGYAVERAPDSGGSPGAWSQIGTSADHFFSDETVAADTTYHYRMRASDAFGISGTSDPCPAIAATTPDDTPGRRLLQPQDFTYLGCFAPPTTAGGINTNNVGGLAVRKVGAEVRCFSTIHYRDGAQWLYEFTPPAEANWWDGVGTFPVSCRGTLARYWGNPYNGKKLVFGTSLTPPYGTANGSAKLADASTTAQLAAAPLSGHEFFTRGLRWDATTNSVYMSFGHFYNTGYVNHPCLLRATLDDGDGSIDTEGPWKLTGSGVTGSNRYFTHNTKVHGGSVAIPQWFADDHLEAEGAKYVGLGFGGMYSGSDAASRGPALFAVAEADLVTANACEVGQIGTIGLDKFSNAGDEALQAPTVASTCLIAYPYPANDPAPRAPGYAIPPGGNAGTASTVPEVPSDGFGYFGQGDPIFSGGAWIDDDAGTRGAHGFVTAATFVFGTLGYKAFNVFTQERGGGPNGDGGSAVMFAVHDPADLAAVAAGGAAQTPVPVPPCWFHPGHFSADQRQVAYVGDFVVNEPQTQGGASNAHAFAWEPIDGRLYVLHNAKYRTGGSAQSLVHVFQVADPA